MRLLIIGIKKRILKTIIVSSMNGTKKDISAMVLRDRNHPSVIMWSIGNEIQERSDDAGIEIAERLRNIVKKLDPSSGNCCYQRLLG